MAVLVGSARSSYGNTARGDQSGGKEVSTQEWYKHSKGWRTFRAKDPKKAELIAKAMIAACKNNLIGYSQPDRNALYSAIKSKGFDPAKCTVESNCDCSSLVRVCCAYAGIMLGNFTTSSEPSVLLKSGFFTELTDSKYNTKSAYLRAGDIQVTKVKGHTIVVISNGSKAEAVPDPEPVYTIGSRVLLNGCIGDDVKDLQTMLIQLDYDIGSFGADGEYGDCTEIAVADFQRHNGLEVTGVADLVTIEKVIDLACEELELVDDRKVEIVGGSCFVRTDPNTNGKKLGIVHDGNRLTFASEVSDTGWLKVEYASTTGWVSGKYGRLV